MFFPIEFDTDGNAINIDFNSLPLQKPVRCRSKKRFRKLLMQWDGVDREFIDWFIQNVPDTGRSYQDWNFILYYCAPLMNCPISGINEHKKRGRSRENVST